MVTHQLFGPTVRGACVSLCRSLAHGFEFYGALILALGAPYWALNFFTLLAVEKDSYPCVGRITS
jgi:hypothetical protein